MIVYGRYYTIDCIYSTAKIKFNLDTIDQKFLKEIPKLTTSDIKFTFDDKIALSGKLASYYGGGKNLSVEIVVDFTDCEMTIGELLIRRGKLSSLKMEYMLYNDVKKPPSRKFLALCQRVVKNQAKKMAFTNDEMALALNEMYAEKTGLSGFDYNTAPESELESFYAFLRYISQDTMFHEYVPDTMGGFITARRHEGTCCLCDNKMKGVENIYPLCKKHLEEYAELKSKYPSSYMKEWKKKFHYD